MKSIIKPDTSIAIGDRVRSHDFPDRLVYNDRPPCYFEGTVVDILDTEGFKRYAIQIEKRVWNGEEETAAVELVYAPVNGTQTTFGAKTFGVVKIVE